MSATLYALAQGVALPTSTTAKTILQMFNTHATQVLYVTRVWMTNVQITAVTGAFQTITLGRYSNNNTTGQTTLSYVVADGNNLLVTPSLSIGHSPTSLATPDFVYFTFPFTGEEHTTNMAAKYELLYSATGIPIFDASISSKSGASPIVLRNSQGLCLNAGGVTSGVGTVDVCFEFYV